MAPDVTTDRIMEIGHAFRASKALLSAVEISEFSRPLPTDRSMRRP